MPRAECRIDALMGKTITEIIGMEPGSGEITFQCSGGKRYLMFHDQCCCESVIVEDVCGDVDDLIGCPILHAEEVVSERCETPNGVTTPTNCYDYTWTFYKFATQNGYVTLRWFGESNGYYSESVDFCELIF